MWAILDESILRRPIGGSAIQREQLDRLLSLPLGVTLQVVPMGESWHRGLVCSFAVMDFDDYPSVAFVEAVGDDHHVDAAEAVARYRLTFDHLRAAGADPTTSLGMIEDARDRLPT